MLRRNLIYTGITRARRLVVLVGQRRALAIAVKDSRAEARWSKLKQWLCHI
jgi:exodeoxyribonuclease V alpha subunit